MRPASRPAGRRKGARRRVLVVGSWAKEHITVEHLRRDPDVEVHAYLALANPALLALADAAVVGNPANAQEVVDYARRCECDLTLVTTAAPLEAGLADAFGEAGLAVFAPTRAAARLECDKAFARELVRQSCPEALPRFAVCADPASAFRFAAELDWQVAVKPLGLTEGLGVRVFGDQLQSPEEVRAYIERVCAGNYAGGQGQGSRVLIEERMEGEEFTIQALVAGEQLVPTPAVQDFKKLLPGDLGPNTASMGSYQAAGELLPFLSRAHYAQGLSILQRTLEALAAAGTPGCGFLYGQFMLTAKGLRLVEFNFRPGDPEWLNTLGTLESPLLDAIDALLAGRPATPLRFRAAASVVKYLVPKDYPRLLDQRLRVEIDDGNLAAAGLSVYTSGARADDGSLDVGSERGYALLACGPTIPEAHERIEKVIAQLEGDFAHRADIGSAAQLRAKIYRVQDLGAPSLRLRAARQEDAAAFRQLAAACPPLEAYPLHQYKILLRYFGNTSVAAERAGELVGFVLGLPAAGMPGTYFLWQIGLLAAERGSGLASRLLLHAEKAAQEAGCRRIEVTVDPENQASRRLFEKNGYANISLREGAIETPAKVPAVRDHYGPGRHFVLLEKRLESTSAPASRDAEAEPPRLSAEGSRKPRAVA